jgi:hypothetical protein
MPGFEYTGLLWYYLRSISGHCRWRTCFMSFLALALGGKGRKLTHGVKTTEKCYVMRFFQIIDK